MGTTFPNLLVEWASHLRQETKTRDARLESEWRGKLEKISREIDLAGKQSLGDLQTQQDDLQQESTRLDEKIREAEEERRHGIAEELASREQVLRAWGSFTSASQEERLLAELKSIETLLGGEADQVTCWRAGGDPYQPPTLLNVEVPTISFAINNPVGLVSRILDCMGDRLAAAREHLHGHDQRKAELAAASGAIEALQHRGQQLLEALEQDPGHKFQTDELRDYYLNAGGAGLPPEAARELVSTSLQPLCQDIVLEIGVWHVHLRKELSGLAATTAHV